MKTKKHFLKLILLFFYLNIANAQDRNIDSLQNWYWGVSVKVGNNYRVITSSYEYQIAFEDSLQYARISLNPGLILRKDIGKRFQFETGLFLNNKGYNSKEYKILQVFGSPSNGAKIYQYSVKDFFDFWYLDVPLKLHYRMGNKKLFFSGGGGIIFNILLLAQNSQTITQETPGISYSAYSTHSYSLPHGCALSGIAEFAVNYSFHNSFVSFFPFYERSLQELGKNRGNLTLYSYGVGLNFLMEF